MKKTYKVILLSSSTGGHAIPLFEVYKELDKHAEIEPWIIHSNSQIEKEMFNKARTIICRSGKFNRHQILRNVPEFFLFLWSFFKSFFLLLKIRPAVIFSKGGFNGVPVLLWARVLRVPYFLHESDSEMGKANRYFCGGSQKTFVSFPLRMYDTPQEKLEYSGFIIRDLEGAPAPSSLPVILFAGGSQGATAINDIVLSLLPRLLPKYRVIHHIGINDEGKVQKAIAGLGDGRRNYEYFVFSLEKMKIAMANATLIVSRSGSTIGEIAALSKASILIPYPYAAANHQMKNARYLEKHGAAIIIKQDNLTPEVLLERIDFILQDPRNAKIIGDNIHKSLKTNGKTIVYENLLNYLRKQ